MLKMNSIKRAILFTLAQVALITSSRAEETIKIGFITGSRSVAGLCPFIKHHPGNGGEGPDYALSKAAQEEYWYFYGQGYELAPEKVASYWSLKIKPTDRAGVTRTFDKHRFAPEIMATAGLLSKEEAAQERKEFDELMRQDRMPRFFSWSRAICWDTKIPPAPETDGMNGAQFLLGGAWRRRLTEIPEGTTYGAAEGFYAFTGTTPPTPLHLAKGEKEPKWVKLDAYAAYPWQIREEVVLPLAQKENVDMITDVLWFDIPRVRGKRVEEWLPGVKFVSLQREADAAFASAFDARVAAEKGWKPTIIPSETLEGAKRVAQFRNWILSPSVATQSPEKKLYFIDGADPRFALRSKGGVRINQFWLLCDRLINEMPARDRPIAIFNFPHSTRAAGALPGFTMVNLTDLAIAQYNKLPASMILDLRKRNEIGYIPLGTSLAGFGEPGKSLPTGSPQLYAYSYLNDMRLCNQALYLVGHDELVMKNAKSLKEAVIELKRSSVYRRLRDSLRRGLGEPHRCFDEIDRRAEGLFAENFTPEMRAERIIAWLLERKIVDNKDDATEVAIAYEEESQKKIQNALRILSYAKEQKGKIKDEQLWRMIYWWESTNYITKTSKPKWKQQVSEVCDRQIRYLESRGVPVPLSKTEKAKLL